MENNNTTTSQSPSTMFQLALVKYGKQEIKGAVCGLDVEASTPTESRTTHEKTQNGRGEKI